MAGSIDFKGKIDAVDETDYKVIKCLELGLDLDAEYPGVRTSRQNARVRIRALRDNANR